MPRICPDCNAAMNQKSFFGELLDTCAHCAGIFFDEGEICRIKEKGGVRAFDELDTMVQPEAGYVPPTEHPIRQCPACKVTMRRFRYMYTSPVFLDCCDGCGGVWVENGELLQMRECLQAAKDGQPQSAASEQIAAKVEALNALERARANRARIAASMIAHHRE